MIRFGRSAIDVSARSVELDGDARHLEPQAFDLLAYLLAHPDRVVPKTELLDEVWGDQFVSESALTTRIKEIRRAVGDDGTRQEVIKNFRGRGYRFVADIDDGAGQPSGQTSRPAVTALFGRDDDITAVDRLLDDEPLVSLVGAGGVGKTSLARDVAVLRRDVHADGVVMVRLASVRDPDAILHVLRRAAGLEDTGDTEAELISALADLDALVVLDNCEHVIDEAARLAGSVIEANGRVRLLATSRERLGLGAERVWPVTPLPPEIARQLLLSRAQAAQPGFELPPESETAVTELLDRLDCLPLAIEMAAARLPTLALDELVGLLRHRLDLLRTPDRSADDRHRTISELIGWSEELLDERERDVLTCLSTFAAPAIATDVAAVAQVDPVELAGGALASVVDRSLVVVDTMHQPTTYRLLETVRANAARRRTDSHEARHANRVIDVVSEMDRVLRTADEAAAARRLDDLVADMRVAHRWTMEHEQRRAGELSAALLHFAYERQWTEPVRWAEELLASAIDDDPASFPAAAACAADAANRGDYDQARTLAEHAIASADHRVLVSAHDTLGNIGIYNGDFATARHHLAMLDSLATDGDTFVRANVLVGETMVLAYGGDPESALRHLDAHRPVGPISPTGAAWIAYIEADVLAALGRADAAIARFEDAQRSGESVGSSFVRSVSELSSLAARSRAGDPAEALAAFVPVLAHYRRVRSTTHAITALRNLVVLLVRAGDDEDAMVLLGAASGPETKVLFGTESEQLDEARSTVEERVGHELAAVWIERGAAHGHLWAVDHAISLLG